MTNVPQGIPTLTGIRPRNPVPVDSWSGPYIGTGPDPLEDAKNKALSAIPSELRFISLQVRLIANTVPYIYWFSEGIADEDLVPFIPDLLQGERGFQGSTGPTGSQGFQGSEGIGLYIYSPNPPAPSTQGLTTGSKWFNTEIGAEFTFLPDNGENIWVMVNAFEGPQGVDGPIGNQGAQGIQGPTGIEYEFEGGTGITVTYINVNGNKIRVIINPNLAETFDSENEIPSMDFVRANLLSKSVSEFASMLVPLDMSGNSINNGILDAGLF
jgi:hypothetical protein